MPKVKQDLIGIAGGVWIATALLHVEYPERPDFSEAEIQARFLKEELPRGKNPNSLPTHINSHCVANRPRSRKKGDPNRLQGGSYWLLYETRSGFRRLFRPMDDHSPDREQARLASKQPPQKEQISAQYWQLLDWYKEWSQQNSPTPSLSNIDDDPLLRLRGSGRHIWADEHADEYVERLRSEGE